MDTRESKTAWIVAGILLVLLIIVGWLWLSQKQSLNTVLDTNQSDIAAARARLSVDCQGPTANAAACAQDKSDLSDLLDEFSQDLSNSTTTTAQ